MNRDGVASRRQKDEPVDSETVDVRSDSDRLYILVTK